MKKFCVLFTMLFASMLYAQNPPLPSAWFYFTSQNCLVTTTPVQISGYPELQCATSAITPTTYIYVDGNRTDTYTATGSSIYPFKTFGAAAAAGALLNAPYAIVLAPAIYTETGAISTGTQPQVLFGNGATLNTPGGVTVNGPSIVYDLNATGNVTYAYTGSMISERHGGSYNGTTVTLNGNVHWYGVTAIGATTTVVNVNGSFYANFLSGNLQIKSAGTNAYISIVNSQSTLTSGNNVDMTSGGQLFLNFDQFTTVGGTYNINLPTANTSATSHTVANTTFFTGSGLFAGASTYYNYHDLSIDPVGALGFALNSTGSTAAHPFATWFMNNTIGPTTVPTGSCTGLTGEWVFGKDGHAAFCNGTTWANKI